MSTPSDKHSPILESPRRRLAWTALGLAAAGSAAWAWHRRSDGLFGRFPSGPSRLPELTYTLIDGRRIGAAELRDRVVLVNFWATSCAVCVAEMPELIRLHADYQPRGFELLAVAMPYDRPDYVLDYAASRRLPFPVALDPMGQAVAAWGGVEATPLSWLAGRDGRIRQRWLGRPDFARLRADIEALLPG
jgi:thiol-disulfide isomerase/thioredoxin